MISIRDRDTVKQKNHMPKEAEVMIAEALECAVDSMRGAVEEIEVTSVGTEEVMQKEVASHLVEHTVETIVIATKEEPHPEAGVATSMLERSIMVSLEDTL